MPGPRLFGKDGSRQSCSGQLRSKADLTLVAVRQCLDLGLLVIWLIVSALLILSSGFAIMSYAVPAFKDLVLPFMGEPVKATVFYRKVHDEGSKYDGPDSCEIIYGYKFNERGRQVDGVSSEYVYRQTYERLEINQPFFVRCLHPFPSFFNEIKRSFAASQDLEGLKFLSPTKFCKIENGMFGVLGRAFRDVGVFILLFPFVLCWFGLTLASFVLPLIEVGKIIVEPFQAASKFLSQSNR